MLPPTAYQLNIRMFLYKSNVAEAFPIAHPRANEVVAEEDHLTDMEWIKPLSSLKGERILIWQLFQI